MKARLLRIAFLQGVNFAEFFVRKYGLEKYKRHDLAFSEEVRKTLFNYHWEYNVRELEDAVKYAVEACHGVEIQMEHLPDDVRNNATHRKHGKPSIDNALWDRMHAVERLIVVSWYELAPFLRKCADENGNINWSELSRTISRERIPLTKVQLERRLKPALDALRQERLYEDFSSIPPEELAEILMKQRAKKA